jgi:hypothetical protein
MIEKESYIEILRHLESKYPQFTKNDIRGYIELFEDCNYDSLLVLFNLEVENNWTKQQKHYYWIKQGIARLFDDAKKYKQEKGLR